MKNCSHYMSVFNTDRVIYNTNSSRHIPLDGTLEQLPIDIIKDKHVHRALTDKRFLAHKPEQYKRIAFIDRQCRIEIMIFNVRGTVEDTVLVVERSRLPTIKVGTTGIVSQIEIYC